MPTRTVYVKEEHQQLWDRAKELVGDESLSEIVAEGLQRVIAAREAVEEGEKPESVDQEMGTILASLKHLISLLEHIRPFPAPSPIKAPLTKEELTKEE